jgi:glycosyltransferase involved in cell wall biosynthesis
LKIRLKMKNRQLKIAMIGSKGIPALFGGIEKHVEEISTRLAALGHDVTVYGRSPFSRSGTQDGVTVKVLPSVPTKKLDTASNALLSSIAAFFGNYDIVHFHGIGPSIFCWIPMRPSSRTVCTVHALDYRQSKWGKRAKRLLKLGEQRAVTKADAAVAVSRLMAAQLSEKYDRDVRYIPNGATPGQSPEFMEAADLGVEPGGYILSVGRFIVERGFDTLIDAFERLDTDLKLVIAGDARFEEEYAARIREMAGDRVILPGYVTGRKIEELYAHCAFYVLPSLVEGLPISLIEAMSHSRPVIVSDIPENLEVSGGIGESFRTGDSDDLLRAFNRVLSLRPEELAGMGEAGRRKVEAEYDWNTIASSLEELYLKLLS